MTSVERVKAICKERKIAISRLEKDLGFSNGYIGQLRKGVFPDDRLKLIADYFNVTVEYLMTGKENEANASELTARDERDIAKDLDRIMGEIKKGDDSPLYYNGMEIDDASLNLLQNAIEFALRETKKKTK
ncbi:MAG: helix-turn-helix domain-containing protein [Lachnospiraceae bacterium]